MRRLAAVLLVALGFAACGGSDDNDSGYSPPSAPKVKSGGGSQGASGGTSGSQGGGTSLSDRVLSDSKDLCSSFPVKQVASEYGGNPADPASVADAYAKQSYREPLQSSAAAGCLKGLR
jgi:hypothetical protein